jgi:hypothetical protein|tara:strand:+ start:83 stop:478 length:396 start_codon:yes stop_codon:yes gene_type:complete
MTTELPRDALNSKIECVDNSIWMDNKILDSAERDGMRRFTDAYTNLLVSRIGFNEAYLSLLNTFVQDQPLSCQHVGDYKRAVGNYLDSSTLAKTEVRDANNFLIEYLENIGRLKQKCVCKHVKILKSLVCE